MTQYKTALTLFHRSPAWLFWQLHGGVLPGRGASYGGRRGPLLCAADSPQASARPGSSRGHHCLHAARSASSWRSQELLQRRHPARLHRCGDPHLSHVLQRLHTHTWPLKIRIQWSLPCLILFWSFFSVGIQPTSTFLTLTMPTDFLFLLTDLVSSLLRFH